MVLLFVSRDRVLALSPKSECSSMIIGHYSLKLKQSSYLSLPSPGIIDTCHHTWPGSRYVCLCSRTETSLRAGATSNLCLFTMCLGHNVRHTVVTQIVFVELVHRWMSEVLYKYSRKWSYRTKSKDVRPASHVNRHLYIHYSLLRNM